MSKKIVIFGAAGTLGLYLTDYLVERLDSAEWEIIASGRKDLTF